MIKNKVPKIMVHGQARVGKDTVCEYLRAIHGLSFMSSSRAATAIVIWPALASKYGYKDLNECFYDRVNHRSEWFTLIKGYTEESLTKLADAIYAHNDIYCGIRRQEELDAVLDKYDILLIQVTAPRRVAKPEPASSYTLQLDAWSSLNNSYLINNDSTIGDLYEKLDKLAPEIKAHLAK